MTRDEILRMAREAELILSEGWHTETYLDPIMRFAALVAAAEREACAKICDDLFVAERPPSEYGLSEREACAVRIRARSEAK
jgi:hypothetical protein